MARRSWEARLLGALSYPANLAFAGLAGFVLSLGVVTFLPALVAVGAALRAWQKEGETSVFTRTFREFSRIWRRLVLPGAGFAVAAGVLVANILFLWSRTRAGDAGFGLALLGMNLVVGALLMLSVTALAATPYAPAEPVRAWLARAATAVLRHSGRWLVVLILGVAVEATLLLVPTLIPFMALSVPVFLAQRSLRE